MKRLSVILSMVTLLIGISTASFATMIDFRDSSWSVTNGVTTSKTVDGTTITATPSGAALWQDSIDGIGIVFDYENDEIEGDEILQISFSSTTWLNTIYIADLFIEGDPVRTETGFYSLDDGTTWTLFEAIQFTNTNGELTIDVGGVLLVNNSIWFRAPGAGHEFAVQGLDVIPEPATISLLGFGLISLSGAAVRRRRKLKRKLMELRS